VFERVVLVMEGNGRTRASLAARIARRWPSTDRTRGASLIELIVAVALLGIAVVAVMAGLGTSVVVSDVHRKQATAGAEVRNYVEQLHNLVTADAGGYVDCAGTTSYSPSYSVPTGYTKSITAVGYWTGTAWSATCGIDTGLQKITLQVASSDGRATETLDIVIRKPCAAGQSAC
jgi:type II secretory pathway pseudopilin PulG